MAVEAESLITPEGPVDPNLFPEDDPPPAMEENSLLYRLETYIRKAEEKVALEYPLLLETDEAVGYWALHLAFRDAHTGMIARPSSEQYMAGLGGQAYSSQQIKDVAAKAQEYEALFDGAVLASSAPPELPRTVQTRSTKNVYDW